ncbi:RNA repair transcriptional activator RtcR [Pendulispora albinea]|uniref:RNA repair transcriptional activator RtcR n=1 Tax=Pendulispora albinea TaxID=2741071 RepID=A0ABZ2M0R3_9BACT
MARRKLVVLGLLGTTLDAGHGNKRWERWRPTVALTQHEDLLVDRLELLHGKDSAALADTVVADIGRVSPETAVVRHAVEFKDPWDFEHVYGRLHDFARAYPFNPDKEDYLVHITTGTHVAQICLFLLTESRYLPARLLQTSPAHRRDPNEPRSARDGRDPRDGRDARDTNAKSSARLGPGTYAIIDLDLSKYDRLASRFQKEKDLGQSFLKSGIDTKNAAFNELIERIERVAVASRAPILLTGPTGAGKSKLARRIFELKKARRQITGEFAEVNCATLRGDAAMSTLFGHTKGAFTGAVADRPGLLRKAHRGVLFLDEIGELGSDEQAMLLRAIEEKVFYPLGSDRETSSDFQLIAGTNRNLLARSDTARAPTGYEFRDDLFARINLWTFRLPALHERSEDIPPNLDFELEKASRDLGVNITMNREATERFLRFASKWTWPGNFRDFNASVTRMATLSDGGRITEDIVAAEIEHLRARAQPPPPSGPRAGELTARILGAERAARLDRFDRVQLEDVLSVCERARSLSDAGRELFANSRTERTSVNDSDRLRKYLARFAIDFASLKDDIHR